jgi:hypothetical protein
MREARVPPADHLGLGARVRGVREEGQPPGAFQHLVWGEGQLHIAGEGGARPKEAAVGSAASCTGSRRQGQRCTPGEHMRGEGARGDGSPGTEQAGAPKLSGQGYTRSNRTAFEGTNFGGSRTAIQYATALLLRDSQFRLRGSFSDKRLTQTDHRPGNLHSWPSTVGQEPGSMYLDNQRDSDTILGGAFL